MPDLQIDTRQLFSQTTLRRFERLEEAEVNFTFDAGDIYLSTFANAMDHIENRGFSESDPELAKLAQVFERFVSDRFLSVSPLSAAIVSSALYWLSGYSANALLLSRAALASGPDVGPLSKYLLTFLARGGLPEGELEFAGFISRYLLTGSSEAIARAQESCQAAIKQTLQSNDAQEYVSSMLLGHAIARLSRISIWASVLESSSAPVEAWQRYVAIQYQQALPLVDLWPSQRTAIAKGLLDGKSNLTLTMPTSAGKTKTTELAFINDLATHPDRKCVYVAPFRALVAEVENSLTPTFSALGIPVASLYGGSETNDLEIRLAEIAQIIVGTPEKLQAVLAYQGKSLSEFGTVVLDEGHLLDDASRGFSFELQLSKLRKDLQGSTRTLFLSAVLPNSEDIAAWLGGSPDTLASNSWSPTFRRVAVLFWPSDGQSKLVYVGTNGQAHTDQFFVPRILSEDVWQERNKTTNRLRTHTFPERNNKGKVAASLAFVYAKSGPVLIYSYRPDWAEGIADRIIERVSLERPIDTNLVDESNRTELEQIAAYLELVLGTHSSLPAAVRHGVAFHHGGLPQSVRLVIEAAYRKRTIRLLIATNTVAQGVNFPARTLIVHSLPNSDSPKRDFWNLLGRAGRALRESEGELIILGTGDLNLNRLRHFLNRSEIEPAESRILALVKMIMEQGAGEITQAAIDSLLGDEESQDFVEQSMASLDTHLLELLAEDAPFEELVAKIDQLSSDLFATYQARKEDLIEGGGLEGKVKDLLTLRGNAVLSQVPDSLTRQRFAKAAISVSNCLAIEDLLDLLQANMTISPALTKEWFEGFMRVFCRVPELSGHNSEELIDFGYRWISGASYSEIFTAREGRFGTFTEAVRYVEGVLVYTVPWVLNAVVRLFESRNEELPEEEQVEIPRWFSVLPQFFRYGVSKVELMWVMSLGVPERSVADYLLQIFTQSHGREPRSLRDFLEWNIVQKEPILELIEQRWPRYFRDSYAAVLDRYQSILQQLGEV